MPGHPHAVATPAASDTNASRDGRYRIGETARMIGVSPSALRLWERQGLVRPSRTDGRYRVYSDADVQALRRVRRLRSVEKVNASGILRLLNAPAAGPRGGGVDGARLRKLRQASGRSLREASAATGLSVSFISSLERGATGASVVALQRLTSAYGATLLELFEHAGSGGRVTRPGARPVLDVAGSGTRIEQLANGVTQMEPQLFVLAADASSDGAYAHDGEEFMFVLRGRLSVWVGDDEHYRLTTGDALYFPSTLPHRWRNESRGETRLLWINTPPTF